MPASRDYCLKLYPWLGALALVAILAALPAGDTDAKEKKHISLSPAEEYNVSLEATRKQWTFAQTQRDVSKFVGGPPIHCVNGAKDSTLCVWPLSKKQRGWWPLAGALARGSSQSRMRIPGERRAATHRLLQCPFAALQPGRDHGTDTRYTTRGRMPRRVTTKALP